MNERIKALSEQINLEIDPVYPDHNQKVLEKFAELIIRECMELGDKALQDGKWPGDVLKEHFGVKE